MKNKSQNIKRDEILTARAFCNLHLRYNFAFVYMKNTLVFSQSDACNFSIYIIRI